MLAMLASFFIHLGIHKENYRGRDEKYKNR